jgi:hypothetical protein
MNYLTRRFLALITKITNSLLRQRLSILARIGAPLRAKIDNLCLRRELVIFVIKARPDEQK